MIWSAICVFTLKYDVTDLMKEKDLLCDLSKLSRNLVFSYCFVGV